MGINNPSILTHNAVTMLGSVDSVDMNSAAATTLYTVPVGKTCILAYAELEVGADAVSTDISIGIAANGIDFLGVHQLDNADADGDVVVLAPVPQATPLTMKAYAAGAGIIAKVANNAGGATNTLSLFGFLY